MTAGAVSLAGASNDALLEILVKKGILSEAEAEELKEEEPVVVIPKSKAVERLRLSGQVHLQYDNISNDQNSISQEGLYFRRLRIGADAKFKNGWSGALVADFGGSDGDVIIDKAYVGWDVHELADLRFGYQKVPFGFYETTSSTKIKTVERSIANRYFIENDGVDFGGRHTGIFSKGSFGDSGFSYSGAIAGSLEGSDRTDRLTDDDDQDVAVFGRLTWKSGQTDLGQVLVGFDAGMKEVKET